METIRYAVKKSSLRVNVVNAVLYIPIYLLM